MYDVKFDYATNTGTQSLVASVLGVSGTLGTDTVTGNSIAFTTESFSFVGDGGSDTLQFFDVTTNQSRSEDGLIDNISVVPEPGSIGLFALAGLGFLARRPKPRRCQRTNALSECWGILIEIFNAQVRDLRSLVRN